MANHFSFDPPLERGRPRPQPASPRREDGGRGRPRSNCGRFGN